MQKLVKTDSPLLTDFDGGDSLSADVDELKDRTIHVAKAAMPEVVLMLLGIIKNPKSSDSNKIEAGKAIRMIAEDKITGKQVQAFVKKSTNEEIAEVLSGESADQD